MTSATRFVAALIIATATVSGADLVLTGTWAGAKAEIPADNTVVLAMYDRNGTCCGGPAVVLAGLGNLRTALKDTAKVVLVAVDVTADATAEQATAAAALHHTDGIPLLIDGARATAGSFGLTLEMTMTYVIRRADGTHETAFSPAQVRKKLGL